MRIVNVVGCRRGATALEYGLLAALVVVVVATAGQMAGGSIAGSVDQISASIAAPPQSATSTTADLPAVTTPTRGVPLTATAEAESDCVGSFIGCEDLSARH